MHLWLCSRQDSQLWNCPSDLCSVTTKYRRTALKSVLLYQIILWRWLLCSVTLIKNNKCKATISLPYRSLFFFSPCRQYRQSFGINNRLSELLNQIIAKLNRGTRVLQGARVGMKRWSHCPDWDTTSQDSDLWNAKQEALV